MWGMGAVLDPNDYPSEPAPGNMGYCTNCACGGTERPCWCCGGSSFRLSPGPGTIASHRNDLTRTAVFVAGERMALDEVTGRETLPRAGRAAPNP